MTLKLKILHVNKIKTIRLDSHFICKVGSIMLGGRLCVRRWEAGPMEPGVGRAQWGADKGPYNQSYSFPALIYGCKLDHIQG